MSSYEILLSKAGKVTMNVNRLITFVLKSTNYKINPSFINEIFTLKDNNRLVRNKYKIYLQVLPWNQVTLGEKPLKFVANIWNSLL